MTNKTLTLTPEIYSYILNASLRETSLLKQLRSETVQLKEGKMQIAPEQGQFLALLIKLMGAQKALEIGTFTGYSTLWIAGALAEHGKLITCDIHSEWTQVAQKYWQAANVAEKIELRVAPALETLEKLLQQGEAGTFDFVFIDADKQAYSDYYAVSMQLIRPGGLIVFDNMLWYGRVADYSILDKTTQAIRELNRKLHSDERVDISLLPVGDGMLMARKR